MSAVCILFIVGLEVRMTRKVLLFAKVLSCQRCDRWSSRKTAPVRCQEARTAHKGLFCFYLPSWKQHSPGEFIKGWHHLSQFGGRERKYSARELSLLVFALCLIFYLVRSNRSLRAHFTAKSKRLPVRVYTPVLRFSGAPKHKCSASEGARVRLNSSPPGIGKWEDPSVNAAALRQPGGQAPVPGQSLDEWEFVWCLQADLIYQKPHVGQVLQLYSQWPWVSTAFFFWSWLV